jgi:hypothetical protein
MLLARHHFIVKGARGNHRIHAIWRVVSAQAAYWTADGRDRHTDARDARSFVPDCVRRGVSLVISHCPAACHQELMSCDGAIFTCWDKEHVGQTRDMILMFKHLSH